MLPEDGMGSSLLYGIHKANCVMAEADVMVVRIGCCHVSIL